jgi:hypothetical protein
VPYLVQHAVQLIPGLADTIAIIAIDDEDQALGVLEVVPPQGADLQGSRRVRVCCVWIGAANIVPAPHLVLSTDIPHGEADVLVLNGLHVEACVRMATTLASIKQTSAA